MRQVFYFCDTWEWTQDPVQGLFPCATVPVPLSLNYESCVSNLFFSLSIFETWVYSVSQASLELTVYVSQARLELGMSMSSGWPHRPVSIPEWASEVLGSLLWTAVLHLSWAHNHPIRRAYLKPSVASSWWRKDKTQKNNSKNQTDPKKKKKKT